MRSLVSQSNQIASRSITYLNLFNSTCQTTRLTASVLGTFSGSNFWTKWFNMMNMVMTDGRHRIVWCMRKILDSCRTEMKELVAIWGEAEANKLWDAVGHGQRRRKPLTSVFSRSIYKCLGGRSKDILNRVDHRVHQIWGPCNCCISSKFLGDAMYGGILFVLWHPIYQVQSDRRL